MKVSAYTSLFNYSPDKFDLLGAFKNWSKYADEIVIGTFEEQKDIVQFEVDLVWIDLIRQGLIRQGLIRQGLSRNKLSVIVVSCPETSLEDPLFDGKLKNAALQACSNELVIQIDADERIGGKIEYWEELGEILLKSNEPRAYAIPTIDLYKNYATYKSAGFKFYFHKKTGTFRGPVNFAKKENGLIDINKSDSCELINENGDLIPYYEEFRFLVNLRYNVSADFSIYPNIAHLGYLDLDKRIENNKFWEPVWSARMGEEVKTATTLEQLEKENEAKPHGLPEKWWEL